jgi:hypothetical protein
MLYAIHDEKGQITQANKVFVCDDELKAYETLMGDLGHKYVSDQRAGLLPPEHWFVDVKAGQITERPVMQAVAQATMIRAGDHALITGIPKGAAVDILAAGSTIYSLAAIDGDELEFPIPVPCKYRATIRLWPFKDCTIEIEAVA